MRGMIAIMACAACYAPTIPSGVPCETACPGAQVCVDQVCREPGELSDGGTVGPLDVLPDVVDAPASDRDGDGVVNADDNCPDLANSGQHDEDADELGDACDPCPHLAGTAVDGDADGVGDACDPQPAIGKQRLMLFDPFTSALPSWELSSTAVVMGGQLRMVGDSEAWNELPTGELRIATAGTISELAPGATYHQLMIGFGFNGANLENFHYSEFYDDDGATGFIGISEAIAGSYPTHASTPYTGTLPIGAWSMQIDESVAAQQITLATRLGGVTRPPLMSSTSTAPVLTATPGLYLHAFGAKVALDYLLVIETLP